MSNNLENLIYFGVALEGVDILDFSIDFLAGVRANYFTANEVLKPELSYVKVKGMGYTFSHNLKKGEGMMWELYRKYERGFSSGKGELLQKSCQCDYKTYCVDSYSKLGFVFKKQYFNTDHFWLKTEYCKNNDNAVYCVLKPTFKSGVPVIEKTIIIDNKETVFYLYPTTQMPQNKKYSALSYTNKGFVFYLEATETQLNGDNTDVFEESGQAIGGKKFGFNLTPENFITPCADRVFDITKAPYLNSEITENNECLTFIKPAPEAEIVKPAVESVPSVNEDKTQSLLDELEKIAVTLLSASEEASATVDTPENTDFVTAVKNTAESIESSDAVISPVFDSVNDDIPEEKYITFSEEKPDSIINSGGEQYNFYGTIINGKRQGHGRTVTSSGTTAYDGYYLDDKRNGFGAFYYKNGDINYLGNWENNKRNGFGVGFRNTDFTAHIGKWLNNIPVGVGARFDNDGNFLFLGEFINGKKQGFGISRDDNGKFIVSKFCDDKVVSSYLLEDIFPGVE